MWEKSLYGSLLFMLFYKTNVTKMLSLKIKVYFLISKRRKLISHQIFSEIVRFHYLETQYNFSSEFNPWGKSQWMSSVFFSLADGVNIVLTCVENRNLIREKRNWTYIQYRIAYSQSSYVLYLCKVLSRLSGLLSWGTQEQG